MAFTSSPLFHCACLILFTMVGCSTTKSLEAQCIPVVPFNLWESEGADNEPEVDLDYSGFSMAEFPNGNQALMEYLMVGHELRSDSLIKAGVLRTDFTILCDIDTLGNVINVRVSDRPNNWDHMYPPVKAAEPLAIDIVKNMQQWKPATLRGRKAIQTDTPLRVAIVIVPE